MKNKNGLNKENGTSYTGSFYDEWYLMNDKGEYRWESVYVDFGDEDNNDITVFIKDIDDVKKREESLLTLILQLKI